MGDNPFGGYPEVYGNSVLTFNETYATDNITVASKNSNDTFYLDSCNIEDTDNNEKYDTLLLTQGESWVGTNKQRRFYANNNNAIIEGNVSDPSTIESNLVITESDSYSQLTKNKTFTGYIKGSDNSIVYLADETIMGQLSLGQSFSIEYVDIGYFNGDMSPTAALITRIL